MFISDRHMVLVRPLFHILMTSPPAICRVVCFRLEEGQDMDVQMNFLQPKLCVLSSHSSTGALVIFLKSVCNMVAILTEKSNLENHHYSSECA